MPLSTNHKLSLIKDLLLSQQTEHFLTHNEHEQLTQLLSNVAQDQSLDSSLSDTISQISSATETDTFDSQTINSWLEQL
ncbi:YtzH-like family protein [Shouchella sp. JSM 1781072]|uniref:YtzH-like family protein n=1 Tax=Bacillaceae TaxID=186817 RepID=UPI000C086F88|nr:MULTISPECIES: YtzH-like family protein [Bacillaceae]UTR05355.1 YtzH-like family protein [Alkalihalobacillus sp. LMS6]